MRQAAGALAAAAVYFAMTTAVAARDDLESIARAFDEAALRVGDAEPAPVVKWAGPIHFAIRNNGAPAALEPQVRQAILVMASLTDIAAREVPVNDARLNFLVQLDDSVLPAGNRVCRTEMQSTGGRLIRADVFVNVRRFRGGGYCVVHEVMHAFGFRSHPQHADSTLTYNLGRTAYTPTDHLLVRALYDRRLAFDMAPAAASRAACRVLAENMHVPRRQAEPICAQRNGRVAAAGDPLERPGSRLP